MYEEGNKLKVNRDHGSIWREEREWVSVTSKTGCMRRGPSQRGPRRCINKSESDSEMGWNRDEHGSGIDRGSWEAGQRWGRSSCGVLVKLREQRKQPVSKCETVGGLKE